MGAGSREDVTAVLKAVVNLCDAAREEVAEALLGQLLELQSGAAAQKQAAEQAALAAVQPGAGVSRRCRGAKVGLTVPLQKPPEPLHDTEPPRWIKVVTGW